MLARGRGASRDTGRDSGAAGGHVYPGHVHRLIPVGSPITPERPRHADADRAENQAQTSSRAISGWNDPCDRRRDGIARSKSASCAISHTPTRPRSTLAPIPASIPMRCSRSRRASLRSRPIPGLARGGFSACTGGGRRSSAPRHRRRTALRRCGYPGLHLPAPTASAPVEAENTLNGASVDEIEVPRITLDSLGQDAVGFIKIDVEGHEVDVLAGAREILRRDRPAILVEAEERHRQGAPPIGHRSSIAAGVLWLDAGLRPPGAALGLRRRQGPGHRVRRNRPPECRGLSWTLCQ